MCFVQANTDDEFWPRLLKDKQLEKTNVKVDWDRWADEDEGDDLGFDMSALDGGMVRSKTFACLEAET